jgi:hypothetical protein
MKTLTWCALLVLSLTSLGCTPVRSRADVTVAGRGVLDRMVFGNYWKAHHLPPVAQMKSMAIAEFNVEFVLERALHISDGRGIPKRVAVFDEDIKKKLPDYLYKKFVESLKNRGKTVTPVSTVTDAVNYGRYSLRAAEAESVTRHAPPIEGSAGNIRLTDLRSTRGLNVISGPDPISRVDQELAAELGVEGVLRVQFRVGIYQGRAMLEQGSVIHVSTPTTTGNVESQRGLASEFSVLETYGYVPTTEGNYNVDETVFGEKIGNLFMSYTSLVVEALPQK